MVCDAAPKMPKLVVNGLVYVQKSDRLGFRISNRGSVELRLELTVGYYGIHVADT